MENYQVQHPVVMNVFKRYDCTKQVFEQVRKVKPKKLYVIADGPRNDEEKIKCDKVRSIFNDIDWNCELITRFLDENYGCAKNSYTGYKWVFSKEEAAIVLEDDCLPSISFFRYCDELLEKYKYDERVYQICGNTLAPEKCFYGYSYAFNKFGSVWGWASWARVWKEYDFEIKEWGKLETKKLLKQNLPIRQFIQKALNYEYYYKNSNNNKTSVWATQFDFCRLIHSGLCITPSKNLISNIGFGEDATHTNKNDENLNAKRFEMTFPLKHPSIILNNKELDELSFRKIGYGTRFNQIRSWIKYYLFFKTKYKI